MLIIKNKIIKRNDDKLRKQNDDYKHTILKNNTEKYIGLSALRHSFLPSERLAIRGP